MKCITFFWLSIIAIFLTACASTSPMYVPNIHNVPMLNHGGDFQLSANLNGFERGAFEFQTAIAVNNKFGLLANASIADVQNCETCFTKKHKFAELGFGTYNFYEKTKSKELFVGLGTGSSEAFGAAEVGADSPFYAKGKYNRIFAQGNFGSEGKRIDRILSLKMVGVHFYEYQQFSRESDYKIEESASGKSWSLFVEPAITGQIGFGNFKFSTQLGFAIPLIPGTKFEHEGAFFALGLHLNAPDKSD